MANIAQVVNVLQSMILTDTVGTGHMVLTPTYYVFKMYRGFQDATHLPIDVKEDSINVTGNKMFQGCGQEGADGFCLGCQRERR